MENKLDKLINHLQGITIVLAFTWIITFILSAFVAVAYVLFRIVT
jgi:hypothetical protein